MAGFLSRLRGGCVDGDDHLDLQTQQLFRKRREPVISSFCIAQLDADAGAIDIAELAQLVAERLKQSRLQILSKYANAVSQRDGLLRIGRERCGNRDATQQFDKFPPPHGRPQPRHTSGRYHVSVG